MWAFAADEYRDTEGYCMGDDDVSRTLINRGQWEPVESRLFHSAVAQTSGAVIDFGAHVGWYTIMAARMGREVLAIEAVTEHVDLIARNAQLNGVQRNVIISQGWIDETTKQLDPVDAPYVAMVKIDLEGKDMWALRSIWGLIELGKVENILCEISPVFNNTYESLIVSLMEVGYTAEVTNPWRPFKGSEIASVLSEPQCDVMFRKILTS